MQPLVATHLASSAGVPLDAPVARVLQLARPPLPAPLGQTLFSEALLPAKPSELMISAFRSANVPIGREFPPESVTVPLPHSCTPVPLASPR